MGSKIRVMAFWNSDGATFSPKGRTVHWKWAFRMQNAVLDKWLGRDSFLWLTLSFQSGEINVFKHEARDHWHCICLSEFVWAVLWWWPGDQVRICRRWQISFFFEDLKSFFVNGQRFCPLFEADPGTISRVGSPGRLWRRLAPSPLFEIILIIRVGGCVAVGITSGWNVVKGRGFMKCLQYIDVTCFL